MKIFCRVPLFLKLFAKTPTTDNRQKFHDRSKNQRARPFFKGGPAEIQFRMP